VVVVVVVVEQLFVVVVVMVAWVAGWDSHGLSLQPYGGGGLDGGRRPPSPVFLAFTFAPFSIRYRTIGSLPHSEAAQRAVVPSGPGSSTSHRADSR
jgi:hypothetical protein